MTTSEGSDPLAELRSRDLSAYRAADATELGQRSILSSSDFHPSNLRTEATLRLSGPGVVNNEVPMRSAGRILEALQNVVSCIGQAVASGTPLTKDPTADVRRRTELSLRPSVTQGSVQLHLDAPPDDQVSDLPGIADATLADQAFARLLGLLDLATAADDINHADLVDDLRELGPTVARRVRIFARELTSADIDVALTWRKFARSPQFGSLGLLKADILQAVIRRTEIDTRQVDIEGVLATISTIQRDAIVRPSGEVVALDVAPEDQDKLAGLFNRSVVVTAEERLIVNPTTDSERRQYRLLSIRLA